MTGLRDRKKRQTRAALARAALRLVAERGLDGVTVEDIAAEAGVSVRTFFNYFPSKDEAIAPADPTVNERIRQAFAEAPPDVAPLEVMRRALVAECAHLADDRDEWLLRMTVIKANPSLLPRLIAASAESERVIAAAVADRLGLAAGHPYPLLLANVTGAAFRCAMQRWTASGDTQSLAALVDEACRTLAAGLPAPLNNEKEPS